MQNQANNMHLLSFDPVNYPQDDKGLRMIKYDGNDTPFVAENCAVYNEDGTATLKYYAPKAKQVQLRYRLHNYKFSDPEYRKDPSFYSKDYVVEDMELKDDGYWYITINPGAGFHSIYFIQDGVPVINTHGPYGYDGFSVRNFIDIPDDPDTELHDVPHGSLTREIYFSNVTHRYRCAWVYTPASYQTSGKEYPVVYIQHGGMQDEVCWFQSGKIDMILDNLIAKGEAEEMIVVCNNGYVMVDQGDGTYTEGRLDDVIINECMPYIESRYRVKKDRRSRAVCGLSMGGGHARRLGLAHPDVFANVGMFSSGECFPTKTYDVDFTELFSDKDKFNEYMDVVYVTCGDADPRYDKTVADLKPLQESGLNIEFKGYKGQHEWNVWRYSAKDFIKKLFK